MSALWNSEDIARATNGQASGEWRASRVIIDSRVQQADNIFIAIEGERFDGHDFVSDTIPAIVSKPVAGPHILVADTMRALEDLGRAARVRFGGKVIGLTGSVGKTTTKEMIAAALAAYGSCYATQGNLNNHIGTPLNLANLPPAAQYGVFEMGMNHPGEIAHLTAMVKPDIALITNVEAVHLEFFENMQVIARAKAEIFRGLQKEGIAILPLDSPYYNVLAEGQKNIITFGEHPQADCQLLEYQPTRIRIGQNEFTLSLKAQGRHIALAVLAALSVVYALKLNPAPAIKILEQFEDVAGRGKILPLILPDGEAQLMDDSYNASPASMRAAFAKLAELPSTGRKIAALGSMLELGHRSQALHEELAVDLKRHAIHTVFTAGADMQALHRALPASLRGIHAAQASDLLAPLKTYLRPGDILLVKGSHGSHMYRLANALLKGAKTDAV